MSLHIHDMGTTRVVTVDGEQMDGGRFVSGKLSVETALSVGTIEELAKLTGDMWLVYNIRRLEKPEEIANNISAIIEAFPPAGDSPRFLDFGCGFGASALAIARMGHAVVGVDVDSGLLRMAKMICSDFGAGDRATLIESTDTEHLPFADGEFDGVIASGVFEHIRPENRALFARECWRLIKPGGVFYVVGTPNRLWPIEGHTTGLPLVHWLPLWAAHPIIRRFCKRAQREHTKQELLDAGLIGENLFGLLRSLPGSELCVRKGGNVRFYFSAIHNRKKSSAKRVAAAAVAAWLRFWEKPLRSIRVPVEAFFPYMNVAIRKVMRNAEDERNRVHS